MKLPGSIYNWTSLIGAVIAIVSLFMIGFLFIISVVFDQGSSYLGLFNYIILPVFLVIGLIIIPIGMVRKHKKMQKSDQAQQLRWPLIDFNNHRNRNAFVVFMTGSVVFLLISAIGSYEAFHYTESVDFCGKLCHNVMKPEYVAYQNSPHARVTCVECHVGSGADWYVKSKLSGLYQVYAVTTGNYPKPIPSTITQLRPARETCEKCHWPEKFYAHQLIIKKHYLADEENTEWDINMKIKTGPSLSALGLIEGIHWHINPEIKVEYIPSSPTKDTIPWVRYTNTRTGEVKVYTDSETPLDEEFINNSEIFTMDCIDCHNRPAHDYKDPVDFIDNALTSGRISKKLPDIKMLSMEILKQDFPTTDSALSYIEQEILTYYEFMYPEILDTNGIFIDSAIAVIQEEFQKNIFPEMKVKWSVYPNNIGHIESLGCSRCHTNKHTDSNSNVISRDCNLCHSIIAQGNPGNMEITSTYDSLEFKHPININQKWKTMFCADCHQELY